MLRRFFFASVAGLIATAALPNVPNAAAADASAFIDDLDAQLQHLIRDTSPDQRFVRFRQIFRADFDVPGIARFVLGPYWRLASPAQQQEFLVLFENYIVQAFSGRLSQYAGSGDTPRVTGSRLDPEGRSFRPKSISRTAAVRGRAGMVRLSCPLRSTGI
jgi:phospholipid transport system substrate-binding protein